MNNRIRELAAQAGGCANIKAFRGHFLPPQPGYVDPATVDLEKFAELIVRECARRSYLEDSGNPEVEEALEFWRKDMLEHFGVEE